MATFKGIIEEVKTGLQHHFEVVANTVEEAEGYALGQVSEKTGLWIEDLDALVCMEWLTQDQADEYENNKGLTADDIDPV